MYHNQRICDSQCAGFTPSTSGYQVTCARCRSFINIGRSGFDWDAIRAKIDETTPEDIDKANRFMRSYSNWEQKDGK